MGTSLPSDIAELKQALDICAALDDKCKLLAQAVAQYQAGVAAKAKAAADQAAAVGLDPGAPPLTDDAGNPFPTWIPLTLGSIPGVSQLLAIIEPPLQVIVVLLQVIATLLQILAAILFGLPDVFRMLILAAYELLKAIIEDLLNTGAYLYSDIPPFDTTSPQSVMASMGFPSRDPNTDPFTAEFVAGKSGTAAPPFTPDGFQVWAQRFSASFDDPGDLQRPTATEGAPIQALFIVMALPSMDALRQAMFLIGNLFNLDAFKRAWDLFVNSPDPRRSRARMQSVPPDWKAVRLQDLFPPLRALLLLPEMLKALLLAVGDITSLLKNLAQALADKAQVLLKLAAAVQAIIDLLEALKATGMYILPVATMDGVDGLKTAFLNAQNRPTGGYVGGVCFLASGPNIGAAAGLFGILGVPGFAPPTGMATLSQTLGEAGDMLSAAGSQAATALDGFGASAQSIMDNFANAVINAPAGFAASIGSVPGELAGAVTTGALDVVGAIEAVGTNPATLGVDPTPINYAIGANERARRRGRRSLAIAYGQVSDVNTTVGTSGVYPFGAPDDGSAPPAPPDDGSGDGSDDGSGGDGP